MIAIPGEMCFTVFKTIDSFYMAWGHILKIAYYYYLFRGIFVSAVTYPYEKLEVAGAYMNRILNSLPVGVMTFDNNLRVSFANQKTCELLGSVNEELVELSSDQVFEIYNRSESQGEALVNKVARTAKPIKNKIILLKNLSTGAKTKIKADVEKLGEWGYIYLMSEARQEQELQNLQLQTKTILNAVGTMVAITDRRNNIIMCNETFAGTMEMDFCDIKGVNLEELYKKLQFSTKKLPVDSRGKHNEAYEVDLITPRGNKKIIHFYPAAIYNVDGDNIGSIIVASDLTQIKEEQQRLYQQEKLASLGQMAAGIVHEIKNPLTSIKGFSQLCTAKAQDDRIKKYALMIEDAANQANKIASDFLSFARPSLPDLQKTSLNKIIDSMRVMIESLSSDVEIKYILAERDYNIMADESQLKQVILNIVKNCIEAMEGCLKPQLTIHTGLNEIHRQVFLKITDNGIGMTIEEQLKAGTPFFTTKDKGTGLGLSICYQIIRTHYGSIDIKSRPKQGTSFVISLPWKQAAGKQWMMPG